MNSQKNKTGSTIISGNEQKGFGWRIGGTQFHGKAAKTVFGWCFQDGKMSLISSGRTKTWSLYGISAANLGLWNATADHKVALPGTKGA